LKLIDICSSKKPQATENYCYGVDGNDEENAEVNEEGGWIENWSVRDNEEAVQRKIRRRQRQKRS